jgi:hypothetical protein
MSAGARGRVEGFRGRRGAEDVGLGGGGRGGGGETGGGRVLQTGHNQRAMDQFDRDVLGVGGRRGREPDVSLAGNVG